jgi:hypothetical protein
MIQEWEVQLVCRAYLRLREAAKALEENPGSQQLWENLRDVLEESDD